MPRIPDSEVLRLKQAVSVVALAEGRGVALVKGGGADEWKGRCCFHADETASLFINAAENRWQCFGCGAKGDVIGWVRQAEGLSFPQAVAWLQAFERGEPAPVVVPAVPAAAGRSRPRLACPLSDALMAGLTAGEVPDPSALARLLGEVAEFHHRTLVEDPLATAGEARRLLERRRVWSPELVTRLRIGFDDRSLGPRLPPMVSTTGQRLRSVLMDAGLIRGTGHGHFRGCVTFPIEDPQTGRIVSLYGRRVQSGTSQVRHVNLPGSRLGVWNALGCATAAKQRDGVVILGEAIIDALSFVAHGQANATACLGVNALTEDFRWFLRQHAKTVILAFDRDAAGERGASEVGDALIAMGLSVHRALFAPGQDANSAVCAASDPAALLADVLRLAPWVGGAPRITVPALPARTLADESPLGDVQRSADASSAGAAESAAEGKEVAAVGGAQASVEVVAVDAAAAPTETETTRAEASETAMDHGSPASLSSASSAASASRLSASLAVAPTASASPGAADLLPSAALHSAAPAASPASPSPSASLVPSLPPEFRETGPDELTADFPPRVWRVRGWRANTSYDRLKVALRVIDNGSAGSSHTSPVWGDLVDLANGRQRQAALSSAASELGVSGEVLKPELSAVWLAVELLQDRHIRAQQQPKTAAKPDPLAELTPERIAAARAFLGRADLLSAIVAHADACGVVGEAANVEVCYLAAMSRKLPDPLAVLIQASSSAGKSSLQDGVLRFVPPEDKLELTDMTGAALRYLGEDELCHKVVAVAEDVGAANAVYSIKVMQSAGGLRIAAPVKNPQTNELETKVREVRGPVAFFQTSTKPELDEELQNRCLVLTVDESQAQTAAVHARQRDLETVAGFRARQATAAILQLHHDAQRLLQPVQVFNPFAPQLTFTTASPRTRRDHAKYLRLIRAIAFLRQQQRPVQRLLDGTPYIEATLADVADANRLAAAVLGRGLDELAPQTRRLLSSLLTLVQGQATAQGIAPERVRITRRQIREHTGLSPTQVHVHLSRLVDLEYVAAHRAGSGTGQVYELAWTGEGQDGTRFCLGLIEVDELGRRCAAVAAMPPSVANRIPTAPTEVPETPSTIASIRGSGASIRGSSPEHSGCIRPVFGPLSGGIRTPENATDGDGIRDASDATTETAKKALWEKTACEPAHRTVHAPVADAGADALACADAPGSPPWDRRVALGSNLPAAVPVVSPVDPAPVTVGADAPASADGDVGADAATLPSASPCAEVPALAVAS